MIRLKLAQDKVDLSLTKVMGIIDVTLEPQHDLKVYVEKAQAMHRAGADLIQIGIMPTPNGVTEGQEQELLLPVVRAVADQVNVYVGILTSNPAIMQQGNSQGASFIVDPLSLRQEGAMQMAAKLEIPVLLVYSRLYSNGETQADEQDVVAEVSEFFYERIDACLEAGMSRKLIMIDPSLALDTPMQQRLKLLGRLKTFKSFALPVCLSLPRTSLPQSEQTEEESAITIAMAIFSCNEGINIIRTRQVSNLALALATWQLANRKAKLFQLSKNIIRRLREIRNSLHLKRHRNKPHES